MIIYLKEKNRIKIYFDDLFEREKQNQNILMNIYFDDFMIKFI